MTASVIGAAGSATGSTTRFRSWTARFRSRAASAAAASWRLSSFVTGAGVTEAAGVGEAATMGVSAVGREHPASSHKQATSRVRAIFFIMVKQKEPWGTRAR